MHVKLIKLNAYSFTNHRKYTYQKEKKSFFSDLSLDLN